VCGIAGILSIDRSNVQGLRHRAEVMNRLQKHRGPDGEGVWVHSRKTCGLAHVRLSIIDLESGQQPMHAQSGNVITYNGEIYNYLELREELKDGFEFRTTSDTEVVLAAYEKWGDACVEHFRGMFAFAIWDEKSQRLFCARDRFGIKPFYYTVSNGTFYFASEIKTLLPFVKAVDTDLDALKDYLTFQFVLEDKTLFKDVSQLLPAHTLVVDKNGVRVKRYWEVFYHLDWDHPEEYFISRIEELLHDSVRLHLRSDVPVGRCLC
jgi:asparagine synthase (glutamine-hydrolysing)